MVSSLLNKLHQRLQWPKPNHIVQPPGAGPAVYSRLARLKIEKPLARKLGNDQVRVSVLVGNPLDDSTDAPIALFCEFTKALTPEDLNETRRLAWNFCRSPILITMEPHLIRVWSCYEIPDAKSGKFPTEPIVTEGDGVSLDLDSLVDTLHWMYLASGQFLVRHHDRFDRNQRADTTLLKNLQYVREQLTKELPEDIAHDLLARIIFVQFLFHRKDGQGNAALNAEKLNSLYQEGVLSNYYEDLSSILRHKSDTFSLFRWLNPLFNGDLFPSSYTRELQHVKKSHMTLLADFVSGKLQMKSAQHLLWQHYSFDTIPLEFISSIYEEFVTKRKDGNSGIGEHYTRPFLVDFMLDKVLPWSGKDYDLKILDPCCGSAVFLVKAFQRLVHRWRNANPGKEPPAAFLRKLLEENIFGVDIEVNAIRVSSFSLYLAMCDEIDPKYYWTTVRFPALREVRLRTIDFFLEDPPEISTKGIHEQDNDNKKYDLIIGNAPWGKKSLTNIARNWAKENGWSPVGNQSGTLFLAKAAKLCKPTGQICMIQPAGSLLFNVNSTALEFRKKLFTDYKVDEVVNLSALRFLSIFPTAVGPACIIKMRPSQPNDEPISYWSPKQTRTDEEQHRIVIDAQDLNWVWPEEAAADPVVWPALLWGGRRDLELAKRIIQIDKRIEYEPKTGLFRGDVSYPDFIGLKILDDDALFAKCPVVTNTEAFPKNEDEHFGRGRALSTYRLPLVLLKTTWKRVTRRFRAIVVNSTKDSHLLYSKSFSGVHTSDEKILASIALSYNSMLSVYFFFITSGRLASYRPSLRNEDIKTLPVFLSPDLSLDQLANISEAEIDEKTFRLYQLNSAERVLVSDFVNITLPDFKNFRNALARKPVTTSCQHKKDPLQSYCEWFLSVLKAGFGEDKSICATIFTSKSGTNLPYSIVAIHLDLSEHKLISYEYLHKEALLLKLADLELEFQKQNNGAIYYRRVCRVYRNIQVMDHGVKRHIPTVFLIKPNQLRYWTQSVALRDADEVASDLLHWSQLGPPKKEPLNHA